jgi:hypothetical protein
LSAPLGRWNLANFRLKTSVDHRPTEVNLKLTKKLAFVGFGLTSAGLWLTEVSVFPVVNAKIVKVKVDMVVAVEKYAILTSS